MSTDRYILLGASIGLAFLLWGIKRWISKVDGELKDLREGLHAIKTERAVVDERFSHVAGSLETLSQTVCQTNQTVGALSGSISRLWTVLIAKGVVPERFAESETTGGRPSG